MRTGKTLRVDDSVALCNRCHGTGEIVGDIHPIRKVPPGITPPAGWPLQKGFLTCMTCHYAGHKEHAGGWKFLRGAPYADRNDFCVNCHKPEALKGRNPHLDINAGNGCEFCHAVRPVPGRDTIKTVKFIADPNILCLRCHATPAPPGQLRAHDDCRGRAGRDDPEGAAGLRGDKIVCATCHNPHVAEVEDHKLRYGSGLQFCAGCHKY